MNAKVILFKYKQSAITKEAKIVIGLFLFFCISVFYLGYQTYKSAEETASMSCVLSMQAYLERKIANDAQVRDVVKPSNEWKILGEKERVYLFSLIDNPNQVDCGGKLMKGKTTSGENLQISVKEGNYGVIFKIEGWQ
jgi:hypothetical protein